MEITREPCSFCGVKRWTVDAMRPCISETTFHSWTVVEAATDAAIHEAAEALRPPAKQGVVWEHTLKWDKSPWGPWCRHSFKYGDYEITVEPDLYGASSKSALGAYSVKVLGAPRAVGPELCRDCRPDTAMATVHAALATLGRTTEIIGRYSSVLVRWLPKAELIQWEGEGIAVILHIIGRGFIMNQPTYNELLPDLVRKYGQVREVPREPTLPERLAVEVVKQAVQRGRARGNGG